MWIVMIAAGILSLFMANSFYTDYMDKEIPWNATATSKDLGKFHAFAVAAELYMRDHAANPFYLPTGTTVVFWEPYAAVEGLKNAKGLPPGLANASIDPTWRINIVTGGYVLCTGMSMGGVVKMSNLPESPLWNPGVRWQQGNVKISNGSNPANAVDMVSFDVDAADAALCRCDPTGTSGAPLCL